jgi:hypothetical protein
MRVGEHDRVERRGVDQERLPVAQTQFLESLEKTAIDQDTAAARADQEAAAGDSAGGAQKTKRGGSRIRGGGVHGILRASAAATIGAILIALVR